MAFGLTRTLKNEIARLAPHTATTVADASIAFVPAGPWFPRTAPKLKDPDAVRRVTATMALPKVARPEEVAHAVVFLASDRLAGHVSGQTIAVAGGMEGRWLWRPEEVETEIA